MQRYVLAGESIQLHCSLIVFQYLPPQGAARGKFALARDVMK